MFDRTNPIHIPSLKALAAFYDKDMGSLASLYLTDATAKLSEIRQTLTQKNYKQFQTAVRELRFRSKEMGAIQFSHQCLSFEMAIQEMRLEGLEERLERLFRHFEQVKTALLTLVESQQA